MQTNRHPNLHGLVVADQFRDFDAFREAVQGWDLDFRQIDRGKFSGQLSHIITPSVILTRCAMSRKVDQYGAPPPGFRTFGLPAADGFHLRWRARDVGPGTLFQFKGNELDCVSNPGFDVFTISISEEALEETARRRNLHSVDDFLPPFDTIQCSAAILSRLRKLAANLTASAIARPDLITKPSFHRQFVSELQEGILEAVSHRHKVSRKRPMPLLRSMALKKALEIIRDRVSDGITVASVEEETGASSRTLRYAFEEEFGLPPKQYIQAYRLSRVRARLRKTEGPSMRISDAANEYGFWHMGQFARDYQRMFDELPSATARRHPDFRAAMK